MKIFVYKVVFIMIALFFLFNFTVGYQIRKVEDKITNISSAEYGEIGYSTANPMGTSNGSRGTISGGYSPPGGPPDGLDTITYVTITTRGSGTDFGELTQGRHGGGATSG